MRIYFVETLTSNISNYDTHFLVKANNKKEAINKIFKKYFEWQNTPELKERGYVYYTKRELIAKEIFKMINDGDYEKNNDGCVCIR